MKDWKCRILALGLIIVIDGWVRAENWPHWRGAALNGSSTETGLPTTWSKTENVLWATTLPGPSAATPVVWGSRVFLSSVDEQGQGLVAICIDATDGKTLWRKRVADSRRVARNNMASPSAVTDGRLAWFLYGTGDLVAFDYAGKRIWSRNLEKDYGPLAIKYGYSSSPLLYGDRLYVAVLRRNRPHRRDAAGGREALDSFLLAIDPSNGKTVWKQVRPSKALAESFEAYTTPIPYEAPGARGGGKGGEIIVVGGDNLTGHDPATGKENWRYTYNPRRQLMWRLVPSPVVAKDLICAAIPRGGALYAVKAGQKGAVKADGIAWTVRKYMPDVCTPLYYKGRLYVLDGGRRRMTCIDPSSGTVKWQGRLGTRRVLRASPMGADDKVYCISLTGEVVVLAADEFKVLARIQMGEGPCASSIAVAGGKLFIRTAQRLYCIGSKPGPDRKQAGAGS